VSRALDDDLRLALQMADAADAITMAHYTGSAIAHVLKDDGSPVSDADQAVEETLRDLVAAARPDDAFLGEEVGPSGDGARRWIVDGIDGTIVFVNGGTGWGTEIALEVDGRLEVGVSSSPAMGARWQAARAGGAHRTATQGAATKASAPALAVSDRASIDGARFSCIPPLDVLRDDALALAHRLADRCEYVPPDEHGALLVADGRADLSFQPSGGPWDYAALAVIVAEAGGRFSDLHGDLRIDGYGPALFSNGRCHDAALAVLVGEVP
jgi:histidinol-phosphatase